MTARKIFSASLSAEATLRPHLQGLLRLTPPELLLAETDNPDSEAWLGGNRNDVALIERVYNEIAGLLGMSRPALEKIIEENFKRIISN